MAIKLRVRRPGVWQNIFTLLLTLPDNAQPRLSLPINCFLDFIFLIFQIFVETKWTIDAERKSDKVGQKFQSVLIRDPLSIVNSDFNARRISETSFKSTTPPLPDLTQCHHVKDTPLPTYGLRVTKNVSPPPPAGWILNTNWLWNSDPRFESYPNRGLSPRLSTYLALYKSTAEQISGLGNRKFYPKKCVLLFFSVDAVILWYFP